MDSVCHFDLRGKYLFFPISNIENLTCFQRYISAAGQLFCLFWRQVTHRMLDTVTAPAAMEGAVAKASAQRDLSLTE